jgi:uncharacterized SAM-binding protein YcdF (DUF218 family)
MKRWAVISLVVLILLVAIVATGFGLVGFYLSPQSKLAKADVIVAISGGETATRTKEAVKLYQDGWAPKLIFSGAALDPNSPSNARSMALAAEKQGVPATDILMDETSTNTRENATNVAAIMTSAGYKSVILVTSPYHQRRAMVTFKRALGPNAVIINHSSYDQAWRRSAWWATPYSRSLTISEFQKVMYEQLAGDK